MWHCVDEEPKKTLLRLLETEVTTTVGNYLPKDPALHVQDPLLLDNATFHGNRCSEYETPLAHFLIAICPETGQLQLTMWLFLKSWSRT
jgi:hypothetical protein